MRFSRRFDPIAALLLIGAAPAIAQTNKSEFLIRVFTRATILLSGRDSWVSRFPVAHSAVNEFLSRQGGPDIIIAWTSQLRWLIHRKAIVVTHEFRRQKASGSPGNMMGRKASRASGI